MSQTADRNENEKKSGLSSKDRSAITSLYESRLDTGLEAHQLVGWGSRESQWLRFEQLLRGLSVEGKSILDVGCGLGHLCEFLDENHEGNYEYCGVDLAPSFIRSATDKYGNEKRRFIVADILNEEIGRFDLVFLSGALSYRIENNLSHAQSMIEKMYRLCTQSVSLNFLTSYADYQLDKNYHYSPEEMFAFGKGLSSRVSLFHDYPLYEFTLQIHKPFEQSITRKK